MIHSSIKEVSMVINRQNPISDYEDFALNYLGIDLEDYVELISDSEIKDEKLDYSLST
jgi:hypothetical protein